MGDDTMAWWQVQDCDDARPAAWRMAPPVSELNHKSLQIPGTKTLLPAVDTTVFEWRSNVNTALSGMRTGRLRCTAQPTAGWIAVSNRGLPPSITQNPHKEMRSPSTGQKRSGTVLYCASQVSRCGFGSDCGFMDSRLK